MLDSSKYFDATSRCFELRCAFLVATIIVSASSAIFFAFSSCVFVDEIGSSQTCFDSGSLVFNSPANTVSEPSRNVSFSM